MKKLTDIRKNEEMYKVPENYFDEFQARMSDLTTEESSFATAGSGSRSLVRLAYAIPAMAMVFVVSYFVFFASDTQEDMFADISTGDLIEFLDEEGISDEELISFVDMSVEELDQELQQYESKDVLDDLNEDELEEISSEIDLYEEYL